tara:strand:+ start:130 stop:345 length:216 start_codon:yes stop_codon:yes gene_type:complete
LEQNKIYILNNKDMSEEEKAEIKTTIVSLEAKLTGDMFNDMNIKDEIHNLQMKLNGTKPTDSHFDCIGCGS